MKSRKRSGSANVLPRTLVPFLCRQLKAYQEILPRYTGAMRTAFGNQSTNTGRYTIHAREIELDFQVLSDPRGIVSAKYNVLLDGPDYLKGAYEKIGLDLESFNGKAN